MNKKRQILKSCIPKAVLKPMTKEAFKAIPPNYHNDGLTGIMKFPFRIGRETRVQKVKGELVRLERSKRKNGKEPTNDLYLMDHGQKFNISRKHLKIELVDGEYHIVDRGSVCGTTVKGENIGGDKQPGRAVLKDGDVVSIGCSSTPYVYEFICLDILKK